MIIDCAHCGAPLDVKPDSWFVTCAYCRTAQRVRKPEAKKQVTPPQWQPPKVWTPPAHVRMQSVKLAYNPAAATAKQQRLAMIGVLLPVVVVFGIMGTVGYMLWDHEREIAAEDARLEAEKTDWDGSTTWSCDGLIEDREVTVKSRLAIGSNMQGGCTLRNVTIKGAKTVVEMTGGYVAFENCTIEASGPVVFAAKNGRLVFKGTTIKMTAKGNELNIFEASSTGRITVDKSTIEVQATQAGAKIVVAQTKNSSSIRINDSTITIGATPKPKAIHLIEKDYSTSARIRGGSVNAGKLPLLLVGAKATKGDVKKVELHGSELVPSKR